MKHAALASIVSSALLAGLPGATAQAATPQAYFISPANGATVTNPVTVKFGLKGMGVAPAGVEFPNTGHHHLLIDVNTLPAPRQPIPADKQHVHFGAGQTETTIELAPGRHTLQLLLGNHRHRPHATPVVSEEITITVK